MSAIFSKKRNNRLDVNSWPLWLIRDCLTAHHSHDRQFLSVLTLRCLSATYCRGPWSKSHPYFFFFPPRLLCILSVLGRTYPYSIARLWKHPGRALWQSSLILLSTVHSELVALLFSCKMNNKHRIDLVMMCHFSLVNSPWFPSSVSGEIRKKDKSNFIWKQNHVLLYCFFSPFC